jgi:hypothetical protein
MNIGAGFISDAALIDNEFAQCRGFSGGAKT